MEETKKLNLIEIKDEINGDIDILETSTVVNQILNSKTPLDISYLESQILFLFTKLVVENQAKIKKEAEEQIQEELNKTAYNCKLYLDNCMQPELLIKLIPLVIQDILGKIPKN